MVSCQVLRKFSCWSLLLRWIILTKASVRIWTLSKWLHKKELPSYQLINTETTYCGFNYWLTHKSNKKWWLSKKEMLLKSIFSLKVTMFDPRNSSNHPYFLSDVLIYLFQNSTCNHPLLHVQCFRQMFSISGVLLF